MRRPWPTRDCCSMENKTSNSTTALPPLPPPLRIYTTVWKKDKTVFICPFEYYRTFTVIICFVFCKVYERPVTCTICDKTHLVCSNAFWKVFNYFKSLWISLSWILTIIHIRRRDVLYSSFTDLCTNTPLFVLWMTYFRWQSLYKHGPQLLTVLVSRLPLTIIWRLIKFI